MLTSSSLAFAFKDINNRSKSFHVCSEVPTFSSASNSVILSMAAYLTWRNPNLKHPLYPNMEIQNFRGLNQQSYIKKELSSHPLFEAWCDSIVEAIFKGHANRIEGNLYVVIEINKEYQEYLSGLEYFSQTQTGTEIHEIFSLPYFSLPKKKIILCNFATSQLRQNPHLPKIHVPALILGTIFNNDQWKIYNVLKGEYPLKSDIVKADAIILPGSSNSVLDTIQSVDCLLEELKVAYEENSKLRVLSICYGHQLVSKMNGSMIVKKDRYKGHQSIKFDRKLIQNYSFLRSISQNSQKQWLMPEHHEDFVQGVPHGFDLIATSNSCQVEAIVKHDKRILGFQFHPQYFHEYTSGFNERLRKTNSQYHACFELGLQQEKLEEHMQACKLIRMCMKQFLDGK